MRGPKPNMDAYMNAIQPTQGQGINVGQLIQNEQTKLRQLQQKRVEFQQQLSMIEQHMMKSQGALEILQQMINK